MKEKDVKRLIKFWNQKLKAEGFKDIESWTTSSNGTPRLLNELNRNENRALPLGKAEYFRAIGIYAHNAPNIDSGLRDILDLYSNNTNLKQAHKIIKEQGKFSKSYVWVKAFLLKEKKNILSFVRELDDEQLEDDIPVSKLN